MKTQPLSATSYDFMSFTNQDFKIWLASLANVEEAGVFKRCAALWSRSIKKDSQQWALDTTVRMVDLTTLEGSDTPGRIQSLCAKAVLPDVQDPSCPSVAAVCVYADRVALVKEALLEYPANQVKVASVSTAFPSSRASLKAKTKETAKAVKDGADEIDMVIDRAAFLSGNYAQVFDEIAQVKQACGPATLKVILEVGELGSLDAVVKASFLAMAASGDTIKTSTGKISSAATPQTVYVMLQAVKQWQKMTGATVGVKAAGGIRSAKDAVRYLTMIRETVGPTWLDPHLFRFGASSLLDDVLAQRRHLATGMYPGKDYFSVG